MALSREDLWAWSKAEERGEKDDMTICLLDECMGSLSCGYYGTNTGRIYASGLSGLSPRRHASGGSFSLHSKKKRATDKNLKLASSNAAFLVQHGRGLV